MYVYINESNFFKLLMAKGSALLWSGASLLEPRNTKMTAKATATAKGAVKAKGAATTAAAMATAVTTTNDGSGDSTTEPLLTGLYTFSHLWKITLQGNSFIKR